MSQREIWLPEDVYRLQTLLTAGGVDASETLGLGFFSASRSPGEPGIVVRVFPQFMRPHLLDAVGRGHVSPVSHETLFLGEGVESEVLPICRWLLTGVQPARIREGDGVEALMRQCSEVAGASSAAEVVADLLSLLHRKVLELRAGKVLFMAAVSLLQELGVAVSRERGWPEDLCTREMVIQEVLTWMAEDFLHPHLIVLPETFEDFIRFIELSKAYRLCERGLALLKL